MRDPKLNSQGDFEFDEEFAKAHGNPLWVSFGRGSDPGELILRLVGEFTPGARKVEVSKTGMRKVRGPYLPPDLGSKRTDLIFDQSSRQGPEIRLRDSKVTK